MANYLVTAKLTSVVGLRVIDYKHDWGKWQTQPGGSVPANTETEIFQATNRDGSRAGISGYVTFLAADGTQFTVTYDDPHSKSNDCRISMSNPQGNYVLPVPSYPTSGKKWTVIYRIESGAALMDTAVFTDDILAAAKCEDFDDKIVKRWIGKAECARLADVMDNDAIPAEGKLWCATHDLFLTPASKSILAQDLIRRAADELPACPHKRAAVDKALELGHGVREGSLAEAERARHAARLAVDVAGLRGANERAAEVFDAIVMAAGGHMAAAWANVVGAYLGEADGYEESERQQAVIEVISARL